MVHVFLSGGETKNREFVSKESFWTISDFAEESLSHFFPQQRHTISSLSHGFISWVFILSKVRLCLEEPHLHYCFCGQMCSFLLGFCSRCVKTKNRNGTNLPTVAGQSAVMMKSVPTCSTGDLTTVTLTHGGQMSLPTRKRNALGQEGGDDGRDSSREKKMFWEKLQHQQGFVVAPNWDSSLAVSPSGP